MKIIMNETYYDTPELSEVLGLSETTIRTYAKTGRIKALKIGKSWYFKQADINLYLGNETTINAGTQKPLF